MIDKIINHPNREVVSRRLANIPLEFTFEGLEINVFWLNYGSRKDKRNEEEPDDDAHMGPSVPFHRHSFFEMHLMLEGESVYSTKGHGDYSLKRGEAIIIRMGQDHCCSFAARGQSKISLSFGLSSRSDSTFARELIACFMGSDVIQIRDTDQVLLTLYQILEEIAKQDMGYEEATKALIFQLILSLARMNKLDCAEIEAVPAEASVDRRVGEIEAFIHEHMSEMITPSDVASSIHISTKQINRILKNSRGMNTTEYIAHVKCAYAKHLLAFTDEPITEIAAKIGYSSVFSFTKFFRRVEGMPPALFRRSRYRFNL